jgi:putative addiction module component (TIGR02574 family)
MIQLQEILDLSIDERLSMIERIWNSIDGADIKLTASHEDELDNRLARCERGETKFTSWQNIKDELNS